MYGRDVGSLEVLKSVDGRIEEGDSILTLSGDKGNEWGTEQVEVTVDRDDKVRHMSLLLNSIL